LEYLYAPENPFQAMEKMANPEVKIISLTITEGGYNFDPESGEFIVETPEIQWDLNHPEHPKTVFGYLRQSLKRRKNRKLPGLTILSCDNIQQNGDVCKRMLLSFIKMAEPGLAEWVDSFVSFPNSMVDRITPATSTSDINLLKDRYGIIDTWPVVCEPFKQWIVEDNFFGGRPEWEKASVQFVEDVKNYEKMKIRLLNAGHSLTGLIGSLLGYHTIDESVSDPAIAALLQKFMDDEVTPLIGTVEGIDVEEYKKSLLQRFANSNIRDSVLRICGQSSAKIPKFLLPTIWEQLDRGGPIRISVFIVACWCRYLEVSGTPGNKYEVQDAMKDELVHAAKTSVEEDQSAFLRIKPVFGDLAYSRRFTRTYFEMINQLRQKSIRNVIRNLKIEQPGIK
jgi:mannitol 2-dehydrogenase